MSMFRYHTDTERIPDPQTTKKIVPSSYSCDICEEGDWMSETEVDIHKNSVHIQHISNIIKDDSKFACMICLKQNENSESLIDHIKTVHLLSSTSAERIEREIFICGHCSRLFFNKLLLQTHIARRHPTEISKNWDIQCPKCFKMLKRKAIWGHLEFHNMSSVSTCPICLEKCVNRADLLKHVEKHRKFYDCGVCQFTTKVETSFYNHIRIHRKSRPCSDENVQNFFVPKYDEKKTVTPLTLQTAMKGLILRNNVYVCVICRQICNNMPDMKVHLTTDHTTLDVEKKKLHTCACGDIFSNKILLKQHIFKAKDGHYSMESELFDTLVIDSVQGKEESVDVRMIHTGTTVKINKK